MIQIYDIGNENYDRNGNAVLTPTAGRVTMQAGGACDISLTLPMDPEGKWRHVVPGAVVKAPVPREVIENSFSGYAADIYKTVGAADLREDKVAPTQISYPQWNAMDMTYHVGSRVSCYGWPHQNYECTYFDNSSPITQVPPYNSAWWKPIADYTPGAAVVVSLPAGSELYWIENAGSGWYKMSTYYGLEGYIQTSAVVFDRHVSETENQPRIITEQLFRLREPSINNETRTVTVTGQHVSYDLAGILCKNITITQASPAMAMGRVVENMMMDYRGTIATNLTSEENGTYTGKTNGKNGMFMLLDPDAGIVHAFNAKFTRDNWDVFVMKKTSALSGFRISYAKNMRGVTWKKSSAGLVTRVVPVAKNTDGEDLYLPEKWVDSAHIAEYPVILMELLRISAQVGRDDGTGTDTVWTESALFDYMREKAGERFSVDHVDEVVDDLTVQFEQLGDTTEYEWIRPLESVLLYDNIVCQDRDIGLEKVLTVTELEWDPIRRKVTGIRLSNITGAAGRTVTGFNVQNNSITPAKLTEEVTQEIVGQVQALIPDYTDPQAGKYTLPPASSTDLGGIKIGFQASGKNYPVALDANNKAYVYVPWDPGSYTLPLAQDGVRGGIQIGFQASGKNYPVALDGEKAYVYVPWTADGGNAATVNGHSVNTDVPAGAVFTDHIYGAGTGLSLANDGTFSVRLAYTTSGKNYKVQADASGNLFVNVPWEDTWRGIQDNLTSTSTTDSLSAAQGRELNLKKYNVGNGASWKPNAAAYVGGAGAQYAKITLPNLLGSWAMLYVEVSIQQSYHGKAGRVIFQGAHNIDNPPTWLNTKAVVFGTLSGVRVFYANSNEIYISLNSYYTNVTLERIMAGDSAAYIDFSDSTVSFVSSLPSGAEEAEIVQIIGSHNYTDYTVKKDGTGASGTWGISVSGSAGSVPWSGVGNPPATATRWPTWGEVTEKPTVFYTLPLAGNGTRGGVQVGYTQSGKNYPVQLSGEKMFVNVPWTADGGAAATVPWTGVQNPPNTATRWPTWAEVTQKPTEFPPSAHQHEYTDVLNAPSARNRLKPVPKVGSAGASISGRGILLHPVSHSSDTYFFVTAATDIPAGKYIFSMTVSGMSSGQTWGFGINGQASGNDIYAQNGRCHSAITLPAISAGTNIIIDDFTGRPQGSDNVYFTDFTLMAATWTDFVYAQEDLITTLNIGSQSVNYAANADKVDGYHAADLLTQVDSFDRKLQVRTGTGTLANNTDTYIAFSSPFSSVCAAVIPVSTSGFNAPNALSIVSNNKNGVTLKQNNTLGVSMNVIVLAVGY